MAELRLKVLADLSKLKSEITSLLKEKFKIGVADGGGIAGGGKKGGKGTLGLLGSILKVLGPVALLLSLKPIQDILSLLLNFTLFAFLKLLKFLGIIDSDIKQQIGQTAEGIKQEALDEVINGTKNIVGSVDSARELNLRETIKLQDILRKSGVDVENGWITNANLIRAALEAQGIDTKNFSDEFLKTLADNHTENINELAEISGLGKIMDDLATGIPPILQGIKSENITIGKDVVESNQNTKDGIIDELDFIAEKDIKIAEDVLEETKSLPKRIWEFLKTLPSLIASALRGLLPKILGGEKQDFISRPGKAPVSFSPNDTIIGTKNPEGIGGAKTFIFNGVTPQEIIDVIKRELGVDVIRSSRF